MLFRFLHTAERLSDEISFESCEDGFRRVDSRMTGRLCEDVDEFEDEEAREGAA